MSKASYFLSLLSGSKVVGWVERQHDWLDKIEADPLLCADFVYHADR